MEWVGYKCSSEKGEKSVYETFKLVNVDMSNVVIVKGFFEKTFEEKKDDIGKIGILRLDNDWYASTKYCLESLYDSVIPGGVVLVDDYGTFVGCRKAVNNFREARGIKSPLIKTEGSCDEYFWVKE